MSALEQELLTMIVGTAPRTPDEPLIYIDVNAGQLRIVFEGTIIPLCTVHPAHHLAFEKAIDRMIHGHAKPKPTPTRSQANGGSQSKTGDGGRVG